MKAENTMSRSLSRSHDTSAPVVADAVAETGGGNVFADLGFDNPAEEQLKADLVLGLAAEIGRRRLSQTAAAALIGIGQPDLSKLLRGRTGGYSLERLLAFTRALGSDIDIVVRRADPGPPRPGRVRLCLDGT